MDKIKEKQGFICDMDGVIYHGNQPLRGAKEFILWLQEEQKNFLFLTNSSDKTPRELQQKWARMGVEVSAENFYTSALATASFLSRQKPDGSAYVIGEAGLINALYQEGFSMDDENPDYVVVGETKTYSYDKLELAINLVRGGARLIGACPDIADRMMDGVVPGTGALIAPIEMVTGCKAYFVGKPNPLIMRHALKQLGCQREDTVIIGDRMDTDIVAGIESEIDTILVMSGVTAREDLRHFAYRPNYIFEGLWELL